MLRLEIRIVLLVFSVLIILLLFPPALIREPNLERAWTKNSGSLFAETPGNDREGLNDVLFFDGLFFINNEGTSSRHIPFELGGSSDSSSYARVLNERLEVVFSSKEDGFSETKLNRRGIPLIRGKHTYVFNTEQNGFSRFDATGTYTWSFTDEHLITGLDEDTTGDVFSASIDGSLFWIDPQGKILLHESLGSGRIKALFGLTSFGEPGLLALVSDLEPQELLLVRAEMSGVGERKKPVFRVEHRHRLPKEIRAPVEMEALLEGSFLFLDLETEFGLFSRNEKILRILPKNGGDLVLKDLPQAGLLLAVFSKANQSTLSALKPDGRVVFSSQFQGPLFDVKPLADGRRFMFSSPSGISSFTWRVK